MTEKDYWDLAAKDVQVNIKYISDVDTDLCLSEIMPYLKHHRILDLGCGVGRLTKEIAISSSNGCCQLYGIDTSDKMLALATEHTAWKLGVRYKLCDGGNIPYEDNFFDSAYSMLTFQHIGSEGVRHYIEEVNRVLKPSGVFRFQYVEGYYDGFVDHNHTQDSIERYVKEAGLKIETVNRGLLHPQWTWFTVTKESRSQDV